MKKSLLSFLTLVICIGLLPSLSFAQDAPGTEGSVTLPDGGVTLPVTTSVPPSNIRNVKRNNGNATAYMGVAEARLTFKGNIEEIQLVAVSYLTDNISIAGVVTSNTGNYAVIDYAKGYISYPLGKNINPAKKLMFHFKSVSGATFCIPETN